MPFPKAIGSPGPANEQDRMSGPSYRGQLPDGIMSFAAFTSRRFLHWLLNVLGFIHLEGDGEQCLLAFFLVFKSFIYFILCV